MDVSHRCDGIWDCAGGEDELSCDNSGRCASRSPGGSSGSVGGPQFACRDQRQCVDLARYCDGSADCDDGSDEIYECGCHRAGQFACAEGGQCVSR